MAISISAAPVRSSGSGRGAAVFAAALAAFIATPWLIRPLEWLLPSADVALVGQIAESLFGVMLGVWMFRMIRRHRAESMSCLHHLAHVDGELQEPSVVLAGSPIREVCRELCDRDNVRPDSRLRNHRW